MSDPEDRSFVVCVGEAALDLRAASGAPLEEARSLDLCPGGGAVNTAIELARLGARSGLCAAVGDEALGRGLKRRVAESGVDVRFVRLAPQRRTGLVFMGASRSGGQSFLSYRDPDAEARALLDGFPDHFGASLVHLSGLVPTEAGLGVFHAAIRAARRDGALVSLDLNARPRVFRGASASEASIAPILASASVIKCARGDLAVMGLSSADELRALARSDAVIFVTAGAEPARALGPFGELARTPRELTDVDPSGAGDAFCAGFLASIARRPSPWAPSDRSRVDCILGDAIDAAHSHLSRRLRAGLLTSQRP